tara:strand:+ start:10746 stop:12296 length:1551 start_codon:yes stop_codon:yes gene_type:complete
MGDARFSFTDVEKEKSKSWFDSGIFCFLFYGTLMDSTTWGPSTMAADDGASRPTLHTWLSSLAEAHGVRVHESLEFRETTHSGRGLFASGDIQKGQVLLSVPKSLLLSVQDGAGMSLPPDGAWPRVRAGVASQYPDSGKTWECVLSRAVVDAVAGDGGEFWVQYGGVMPPPEALALPFLIPDDELNSLQDPKLAEVAIVTRARIAALMPDLLEPVGVSGDDNETNEKNETIPAKQPDVSKSVAAWALALVRSRCMLAGSVQGGGNARAIVPFIDLANHASIPNADYRCDGVEMNVDGVGAQEDKNAFQLVCIKKVNKNEEITLAYTKGEGTSRDHFAQYGFVPNGGYARDRVPLGPSSDEKATRAIEGKTATRLLGSLKLKLKHELISETETDKPSTASWVAAGGFLSGLFGGGTTHNANSVPMTDNEETMTLNALRNRIDELENGWATSLADDEKESADVAARVSLRRSQSSSTTSEHSLDERLLNVLGLRLNKKRLLAKVKELLRDVDLDVMSA